MKYKFRAECLHDIALFLDNLRLGEQLGEVKIIPQTLLNNGYQAWIPDCEVEIEIRRTSLEEIRETMRKQPDAHVMVQSLNTAEEYTGERWYGVTA